MIAEDVLERALGSAAEDYDVPDGALDRLREQLAPSVAVDDDEPDRLRRLRRWRPTPQQWLAAGAAAVVLLVAAAFAVGGSGGGSGGGAGGSSAGLSSAPKAGSNGGAVGAAGEPLRQAPGLPAPSAIPSSGRAASATAGSVPGGSDLTGQPQQVLPVPSDSARVVKTGELDLQVRSGRVSTTLDRLTGLAGAEHGYISDTSTSEGGDAPSGRVTMRVPVGAFEDTVTRARGLGKVLSLQTSGRDVTAQYTDLSARIKALEATRSTFLTIMSKATTIGETLAVQQHITDVQTQIDQLQGRRNVLANQSSLATLTVTVDQAHAAAPAEHQRSGMAKAVDRSVGRFVRGVEAIVGVIGPIVLALLVLVIGWFATRLGYRVLRRRLV